MNEKSEVKLTVYCFLIKSEVKSNSLMLFLFLVTNILAAEYTVDFSNQDNMYKFHQVSAKEYSSINIINTGGKALMLVEWDDAIVGFIFEQDRDNKYIITKDAGLSFFTFKDNVFVSMTFKSDVSFYAIPYDGIDTTYSLVHINNYLSENFNIDQTNMTRGMNIYSVQPYNIGVNAKDCSFSLYNSGQLRNQNPAIGLIGFSSIKGDSCNSGVGVSVSSDNLYQFNPTVPTVVETFNNLLIENNNNFKNSRGYGGTSSKFYDITDFNKYQYIFLKNEIKDDKKYKLFVTRDNQRVEVKKGETFSAAQYGSFQVALSMSSKECSEDKNFKIISSSELTFSGDQPVAEIFNDDSIPGHCRESKKTSPGIIAAIVIVVIVVVAAIVGVVVFIILKKKKENHSSQEGNNEMNAQNA